jgi:ribose transport system substrate-binding protein
MIATLNQLKAKSNGEISKVIVQDSNNSLQTQIQQIQGAIRQKVDVMIVLPLSPAGDAPVEAAAGKAGIPVLAPLNPAANKYVVGVQGNIVLEGAKVSQTLASILGNKGNVLDVHGIPGVPADALIYEGSGIVFKNCPDIKTAGSIVGQFTPSVAKAQSLEFLASHPAPVDAAIQTGGMATGIMQAFIQTGRHVPTVADVGATPGALGYWAAHKSTYKGVASAIPPIQLTEATWNLALGLLHGQGIKITNVEQSPIIITDQNLDQWVQPGWNLTTPIAYAPGPPGALLPASYLNQFFTKPAAK